MRSAGGGGHRQHRHRRGERVLAHGVAEEVGVGVGELLVGDLDHPPPGGRAGEPQVGLRHHRRGRRVDLQRFPVDADVERGDVVGPEHRGRVDQRAPVVEPRGEAARSSPARRRRRRGRSGPPRRSAVRRRAPRPSASERLQWITTCQPASAKRRTIAAPMRRAPPVTRTAGRDISRAWRRRRK